MSMEDKRTLMIVEDDLALQKQIKWSLDLYESVCADDRESALLQFRKYLPSVVTMDLGLPPDPDAVTEGLKLLSQLLSFDPHVKVLVMTGQNDQANALHAIAMGAFDFLEKPVDADVLRLTVERAFRIHALESENLRAQALQQPDALLGLMTNDPQMLKICRTVAKVATSQASVLLLGESGTGKEVLARGLHQSSARAKQKFVAINCAAIPDNLLESELFGFEKGAFTGAFKTTPGKFELASGGTLMLDEIGDLPFSLQAKFLRFLQERKIERLGGRQEIAVDVRIVCATHHDLKELCRQGRFREDLYYRLAEIVVEIPPLRARMGDANLLAHAFVKRFSVAENRVGLSLNESAVRAIEAYAWPGNVRELENCLRRAVIMAEGKQITSEDLGLADVKPDALDDSLDLRLSRNKAEKQSILAALGRVNGNLVKASELLGVSRPTLYDLMYRLGLK